MDQSPPRRLSWLALAGLVGLSACIGQEPPERTSLPDVAALVEPGRACSFVTGSGTGVIVDDVLPATAADGLLEAGDVLVELDGSAVRSTADVRRIMAGKAVGDVVALEVERAGGRRRLPLTLTASPDEPTRPRIGIAIVTRFEEVEPADLPAASPLGPYSRLIEVDGAVFALDPQSGLVVPTTTSSPDAPWFSVGRVLFRLEGTGSSARIVGTDGTRIEIADDGVAPYQVIGAVGESLLMGLAGTDGAVYLARIEPASPPTTVWNVPVEEAFGVPGAAFPSPDRSRILVVGFPPGADGPFRLRVLDASSGDELPGGGDLGETRPAVAFGWFDDERVVVQTQDGAIALLSVIDGTLEPFPLRVALDEGDRLFPVGDGVHLLVARPFELLRTGLDAGIETRRLVARCDIGWLDLPGSAG